MADPFFNKEVIKRYFKYINNDTYTIEYTFIDGKLKEVEITIGKIGGSDVRLYFGSGKDFDDFLKLLGITKEDMEK